MSTENDRRNLGAGPESRMPQQQAAGKQWEEKAQEEIEAVLGMLPEAFCKRLPGWFEEMETAGVGSLLKVAPDVLLKIIRRFREAGAAQLFSAHSPLSERFSRFLWTVVAAHAETSEELKAALRKTKRELHVNIEAEDSPFQCHFVVSGERIRGGVGLLHFRDEDYRIMGPTETLLDLLTGDLPLGFSNLHLQTAGHSGFAGLVSPVVREITGVIRGSGASNVRRRPS